MKRHVTAIMAAVFVFAAMAVLPSLITQPAYAGTTGNLKFHYATKSEAQDLMKERKQFHEMLNSNTLSYFLHDKDATEKDVQKYIDYSVTQADEFTKEEKITIDEVTSTLNQMLAEHHLALPNVGEINIVKTKGGEAEGAGGYTSEGNIFLASSSFEHGTKYLYWLILHELSHCLSRVSPSYRTAMYSTLGFKIGDKDIKIPEEIQEVMFANPDVERHDSHRTFTIDGEEKDCYMVLATDQKYQKEGDLFTDHMYVGLVSLDDGKMHKYDLTDITTDTDFAEMFGKNTLTMNYEDPEEIAADLFADTISDLGEGYEEWKDPSKAESVLKYLRSIVKVPEGRTLVYDGKKQTGVAEGEQYTIKGNTRVKAGTYTAVLKLKDPESRIWNDGTKEDQKITWTIEKAENSLSVKPKTATIKYKNLKKKTQKLPVSKVVDFVKKGQGKRTYLKKAGNKKITIDKKTGKVTVKKGLKKGTYKVKVIIKAAGTKNYKASGWEKVTFKVRVK